MCGFLSAFPLQYIALSCGQSQARCCVDVEGGNVCLSGLVPKHSAKSRVNSFARVFFDSTVGAAPPSINSMLNECARMPPSCRTFWGGDGRS